MRGDLWFNVIAISIIVFLIIFIYFFSRIYFEMNRADGRSRSAYGLLISLLWFFALDSYNIDIS